MPTWNKCSTRSFLIAHCTFDLEVSNDGALFLSFLFETRFPGNSFSKCTLIPINLDINIEFGQRFLTVCYNKTIQSVFAEPFFYLCFEFVCERERQDKQSKAYYCGGEHTRTHSKNVRATTYIACIFPFACSILIYFSKHDTQNECLQLRITRISFVSCGS